MNRWFSLLFIILVLTIITACSEKDPFPPFPNSEEGFDYGNVLICESRGEVLLEFPLDLVNHSGPYLFRMQCQFRKKDIPDICFEYKKNNGEIAELFLAPIPNTQDTIEYVLPPLLNDYIGIQARLGIRKTKFDINYLSFTEYPRDYRLDSDIVFHAHLGYLPFTPENTLPSFDYCGKCLFQACIVTPIESSDGVLFCYHENNKCLSNDNGNSIISLSSDEFHALSSDVILKEYDAGVYKGEEWKNTTICTVDDFLKVCSDYKMSPTFSTHPMLSDNGWKYVKDKLDEYGLTQNCTIKAFSLSILRKAYSVFGSSINKYVFDAPLQPIEITLNDLSGLNFHNVLLGIELPLYYWNESMVNSVVSEGRIAAAHSIGNDGKYVRDLVLWGVTEFTSNSFIMYSNWMSL